MAASALRSWYRVPQRRAPTPVARTNVLSPPRRDWPGFPRRATPRRRRRRSRALTPGVVQLLQLIHERLRGRAPASSAGARSPRNPGSNAAAAVPPPFRHPRRARHDLHEIVPVPAVAAAPPAALARSGCSGTRTRPRSAAVFRPPPGSPPEVRVLRARGRNGRGLHRNPNNQRRAPERVVQVPTAPPPPPGTEGRTEILSSSSVAARRTVRIHGGPRGRPRGRPRRPRPATRPARRVARAPAPPAGGARAAASAAPANPKRPSSPRSPPPRPRRAAPPHRWSARSPSPAPRSSPSGTATSRGKSARLLELLVEDGITDAWKSASGATPRASATVTWTMRPSSPAATSPRRCASGSSGLSP